MFFCDIKDNKLQSMLIKIYDIRCYEFLYLNGIYPVTEQKEDENGIYFQYVESDIFDEVLEEYNKIGR